MDTKELTKATAKKLFDNSATKPPYYLWKEFDRDLARQLSQFISANLYARTVLSPAERQLVACTALATLRSAKELKLHIIGALNVGCDPRILAEAFFQISTYAGMPCVNNALEVLKEALEERGEWPLKEIND
ncbi:MAG: carboxymuconolactone decarboxylase family protein [Deltaproteobacteria bacterium]|nr:carboxymuconolactone decarboxylase family protein [Deltaproteobacteria bacterium]